MDRTWIKFGLIGTVRFVSMELKFIKSSYLSIRLLFFFPFLLIIEKSVCKIAMKGSR